MTTFYVIWVIMMNLGCQSLDSRAQMDTQQTRIFLDGQKEEMDRAIEQMRHLFNPLLLPKTSVIPEAPSPHRHQGRGSRVVKVSDRGLPCHKFEPCTTKDPPRRAAMHVKSVES
ncbi:hypothetical protein TNCV_207621 [Trichonephila clavipes]|nr:hypothetical protein TNCV_207621 [Trichonephila clavipes]